MIVWPTHPFVMGVRPAVWLLYGYNSAETERTIRSFESTKKVVRIRRHHPDKERID
jgi:hypothetical protein